MITIKALLMIASIAFDATQGLFIYPTTSVSDIFVAGEQKEFSRRVCNQSASAMLGTVDGYISRMVIPSLVNYGGAKNINKLEELANKNWADYEGTNSYGEQVYNYSLYSNNNYVPYGLYAKDIFFATNRNYASINYNFIAVPGLTTYGRIRKFNNIFDFILGDEESFDQFDRYESLFYGGFRTSFNGRPELYWLCNNVGKYNGFKLMSELPENPSWKQTWEEFDPFKKGYALQICELSKTNFLGSWSSSTLGIFLDPTYILLPTHSQEFIEAASGGEDWKGGLELFQNHLGYDYLSGLTNCSARAISNNYPTVADLMNEVSPNSDIDYTIFTNRPTKRIWKERFAFANSLISLHNMSLIPFDFLAVPRDENQYSLTNWYDFTTVSGWMKPSYALHHEKYNGKIRAELTMNLNPSVYFNIIKNNYTEEDHDEFLPPYYTVISLDDYSDDYFHSTNQLNSTINYFPELVTPVMAWVDESGFYEINLRGGVEVKLGDIFYSIESETSDSEWKDVIVRTTAGVDQDGYEHAISLNGGESFIGYSPPTSTNWNVVLSISYYSNYYGTQFHGIGSIARVPDFPINTSTGFYHSCSYMPLKAHRIMDDFVNSISVNTFAFIAVSTNMKQVAAVARGGLLSPGQMFTMPNDPSNPEYIPPQKDMWFFAGMRNLCKNVKNKSSVDSYLMTLYDKSIDYMENVHKDMPSASKSSASSISSSELKSILERVTENNVIAEKNIISIDLRTDGGSEGPTGYEAKGGKIRRKSDKVVVNNWKDLVIDSYSCSGLSTYSIDENNPARRSSAKMYMEEPHAIVEWNFPCMNYKYVEEK